MEELQDTVLLIDEELAPQISEDEARALSAVQKKFMKSYLEHKEAMSVEEWLRAEMGGNLPDRKAEEIDRMSGEIITELRVQEEKKAALEKAVANGRSKESWFADEVQKAASHMSAREASKYLQNLDDALSGANESLYQTIHTQAGAINRNPYLDGFIAEQYHAQTLNLNAEAAGSRYRAKVLERPKSGYPKNSVDIVIVDDKGKIVRRYQSKYCKDAEATARAFEQGDYRGQQKLVPEGQETGIAKKTTTVLETPDGIKSTPLTKKRAKELQAEAQSGKWNDLNWNEYRVKDLAAGIGKQAGQAALMGAAVGVGFDLAQKVWNGEEIDGGELVETAVVTGADFGVKAAAAGALKVGAEKGLIKVIPKGTPAALLTDIVHIAVENVKVIGEMAEGKLTMREGLDKMEQVTVSTVAGISASAEGAAIGAAVGTVLGPVGTAIGGFVGGAIGYMAGSKVGGTVVKCVQKIRETARDVISAVGNAALDVISTVSDGIFNFCSGVKSLFGW